MSWPRWNPRRIMDWVAVLFPLAVSVAANTIWAARAGDPITIGFGVVIPILLVIAVERWHVRAELVGWQYAVRVAAIISVTAVVAAISWAHTSLLLYHHGWEPILAVLAPLGIDGLAVLGTLALWPAAPADEDDDQDVPDEDVEPAAEPVPDLRAVRSAATDSLSELIAGNVDDVRAAAKALDVKRERNERLDDLRARCRAAMTPTDPNQQEA